MFIRQRLITLVKLFNILCLIHCVNSATEQSEWEETSTMSETSVTASTENLMDAPSTSRQDASTWISQNKSFINIEENTIISTSSTGILVEDTTTAYTTIPTATTEIPDQVTTPKLNGTNEAEPEIPECDSVVTSPASYMSNYLWSMKENYESSIETTDRTKEEIRVEDLTNSQATPDSLTISWKRPNQTVEVTYYFVEWLLEKKMKKGSCKVTKETGFHKIVISSLTPCTMYTVKVTPYMKLVAGSYRVVTGKTGLNVNNDNLSLKIVNKTTDSIKISWNMPGTDCVAYYLVKVCQSHICSEANITETTFVKSSLSPCLTYFFNLTVYGGVDSYGTVNTTGTTNFLTPEKPSSAVTKPGHHILLVAWEEPIGHTCAKFYRLTWSRNGESKTEETTRTSVELKNLESCAVYEIVISTVWDTGESEQERIRSKMTLPDATDPPLALQDPTVGKDEISMRWLINTNETNNCSPITLGVNCIVEKTLGEGYTSSNGSVEYRIEAGTKNFSMVTTIKELNAFTNYVCRSVTSNMAGQSSESSLPIFVTTMEDVPSAPALIPALQSNVTNTSITVMWKRPSFVPGILKEFRLEIIWQYNLHRPSWCEGQTIETQNLTISNGSITSFEYDARPKSQYLVKILAATGAGMGNASKTELFLTRSGAPSEVTNLSFRMTQSTVDPNILDVTIIWGLPCFINADTIEYFSVIASGNRPGFPEHKFNYIINYSKNSTINDTCAITIDNLREEHTYEFTIATKVGEYSDLGHPSQLSIEFPAGIPPPPDENYTNLINIDPLKARRTATTATILLPIFPNKGGTIRCYAIIVSKLGYNNGTFGRCEDNTSWPQTASWIESKLENFVIPYEAVKFCSDSYPSYVADYGRLKAVKFVLGEDTETCPEISSNRDERSYCNGPLNPDTWYHVRMRAFTNGGYRDSIAFTVKTNAELQVAVVIGTIFGILFLGIVTTMMLLVRKCSLQVVLRRFLHSDMSGSPVPAPFTRRKFIAHCQQLADNPGMLSNEYQLLQTLSVDLQMPTNAACLQANRKKNRYTDILPYDFSRVKLEVIDNDPNTDYVNASFINGFNGNEDYIACQGPKEETTYDFWRMIDQYKVKIIVMLTQLVEKNKEKCHQYFPTIRETFTYENMAIRCTSELDYRTYTHRTLVLQKENEKRTIIHLHFKDWPDHDVPEDFDPMINFCQVMRRHMQANPGLVVVHCSAGIGRTGTLIAIDILLQHIKENRKLDVFGTVYRLRHHRINMVQRESQYAYIYNCIKQVLKNPYFSKNYKPPSVDPILDNNSHKKKEASNSSTNLVSSFETLKKSSFSTSVDSAEPIYHTSMELKSQICYPLNGLRCAKSTSAINTKPCEKIIGRYNTHDHPISNIIDKTPEYRDSDISCDLIESEGSTTSLYENMQPLLRSKSAQIFGREEDSCVIQNLLEDDTIL